MDLETIRKQVRLELGMGYGDHVAADWATRCRFVLGELDAAQSRLDAMTKRAESAESDWQEATNTIARIWEVLGSPDYQELKGRSIYDVIQGWIDLALERERRLGRIAELLGSLECWEHPDDPALSVIRAEHIHATDEAWEIARGERAVERQLEK